MNVVTEQWLNRNKKAEKLVNAIDKESGSTEDQPTAAVGAEALRAARRHRQIAAGARPSGGSPSHC